MKIGFKKDIRLLNRCSKLSIWQEMVPNCVYLLSRNVTNFQRTLPNEKRIPELFGEIETTEFQWISDTKWLPVQCGDCEEVGKVS